MKTKTLLTTKKHLLLTYIVFILVVSSLPLMSNTASAFGVDYEHSLYVAGSGTNFNEYYSTDVSYVTQLILAGMSEVRTICKDDNYVYFGGNGADEINPGSVASYQRSDLTLVVAADVCSPDNVWCMEVDDTYLYVGGQSGSGIYKVWKSNLTVVDTTIFADGGTVYDLEQDETYLYAVGDVVAGDDYICKYWKSNLTEVMNSSLTPHDQLSGIVKVGNNLYIASLAGGFWLYTASLLEEQETINTYITRSLDADSTYVYQNTWNNVTQYWNINQNLHGVSPTTGFLIMDVVSDEDYVYLGGLNGTDSTVWQLQASDMTKVAETAVCGFDIYSLCVDTTRVTTLPATFVTSTSARLNGVTHYGVRSGFWLSDEWDVDSTNFDTNITPMSTYNYWSPNSYGYNGSWADWNHDHTVDSSDWPGLLLAHYRQFGGPWNLPDERYYVDFNRDGRINYQDISYGASRVGTSFVNMANHAYYSDVTLQPTTHYSYLAWVNGTFYTGLPMTLITIPLAPNNFKVKSQSGQTTTFEWIEPTTNDPANLSTMIRYSTTGCPANETDGTLLTETSSESATVVIPVTGTVYVAAFTNFSGVFSGANCIIVALPGGVYNFNLRLEDSFNNWKFLDLNDVGLNTQAKHRFTIHYKGNVVENNYFYVNKWLTGFLNWTDALADFNSSLAVFNETLKDIPNPVGGDCNSVDRVDWLKKTASVADYMKKSSYKYLFVDNVWPIPDEELIYVKIEFQTATFPFNAFCYAYLADGTIGVPVGFALGDDVSSGSTIEYLFNYNDVKDNTMYVRMYPFTEWPLPDLDEKIQGCVYQPSEFSNTQTTYKTLDDNIPGKQSTSEARLTLKIYIGEAGSYVVMVKKAGSVLDELSNSVATGALSFAAVKGDTPTIILDSEKLIQDDSVFDDLNDYLAFLKGDSSSYPFWNWNTVKDGFTIEVWRGTKLSDTEEITPIGTSGYVEPISSCEDLIWDSGLSTNWTSWTAGMPTDVANWTIWWNSTTTNLTTWLNAKGISVPSFDDLMKYAGINLALGWVGESDIQDSDATDGKWNVTCGRDIDYVEFAWSETDSFFNLSFQNYDYCLRTQVLPSNFQPSSQTVTMWTRNDLKYFPVISSIFNHTGLVTYDITITNAQDVSYINFYFYDSLGNKWLATSEFLNAQDKVKPMLVFGYTYFMEAVDSSGESHLLGTFTAGLEQSELFSYLDLTSAGMIWNLMTAVPAWTSTGFTLDFDDVAFDLGAVTFSVYNTEGIQIYEETQTANSHLFTFTGDTNTSYYWKLLALSDTWGVVETPKMLLEKVLGISGNVNSVNTIFTFLLGPPLRLSTGAAAPWILVIIFAMAVVGLLLFPKSSALSLFVEGFTIIGAAAIFDLNSLLTMAVGAVGAFLCALGLVAAMTDKPKERGNMYTPSLFSGKKGKGDK